MFISSSCSSTDRGSLITLSTHSLGLESARLSRTADTSTASNSLTTDSPIVVMVIVMMLLDDGHARKRLVHRVRVPVGTDTADRRRAVAGTVSESRSIVSARNAGGETGIIGVAT